MSILCKCNGQKSFLHLYLPGCVGVGEGHGGAGAGVQAARLAAAHGPEATVRVHRDAALPVDGLPGHTHVPVRLVSNLELQIEKSK